MYTVYIPKYRGERPDFNIIRVISKYMQFTNYNCKILASPGYMNTKETTTNEFYDNIVPIFLRTCSDDTRKVAVGIFNGMNGTRIISGGTISCREQHEISIVSHHLKLISLRCRGNKDHKKMFFFMETEKDFDEELTIENYNRFLETIEVRGVMIGSSNQSLKTYYGGSRKIPADKGEADIFMFVDDKVKDAIIEANDLINNIVISETLVTPGESDTCYLKSILEDFLRNSLE